MRPLEVSPDRMERAPDRLRHVGRGSLLNLAGAAVSSVSAFLITVVVAQSTSRGGAGVFFSVTSLFLLVTGLGQLGTNTGLVYFLSRDRVAAPDSGRPPPSAYMRIAVVPVVVAAVVLAVLLGLLAGWLGTALAGGADHTFGDDVRVLALFVVVAGLGNLAFSGTRGMGTMRPSAVLDQIVRPVAQLGLVAAVSVLGFGQGALAWAWALPYLPAAVLGWWAWRRLAERTRPPERTTHRASGREFWRFTTPRAVSSVAQVAMQRLDIVLVAALAGLGPAAVYAAASRFLSLGQLAAGAIGQAVQPQLGEVFARQETAEGGHLYKTATGWVILLTWPLYLLLIVDAGTILRIFGTGYSAGRDAVLVLCLSMLVATAAGMVDMVLLMTGKTSWNLYNVLLAFGVNVSLDLILIRPMGILGAAVAWAVAIVAANLVPLAQVRFSIGIHPFGSGPFTAMGCALVWFLFVPGVARLVLGAGWLAVFAGAGIGLVGYVLAVLRMRGRLHLAALLAGGRILAG